MTKSDGGVPDGPRVAPGTLSELGILNWVFARGAARVIGVRDAHVFSTLGRTRGLFRSWLLYSSRLMPFGSLSRRDSEMVIIRVAHLRGSEYELDHHRRLGKRAGIDDAEFARIISGPDAGWGDRERWMLCAVDELIADKDISDTTWTSLRRHLDERRVIAFILLALQYDSLATTLHTLRVQRDIRV